MESIAQVQHSPALAVSHILNDLLSAPALDQTQTGRPSQRRWIAELNVTMGIEKPGQCSQPAQIDRLSGWCSRLTRKQDSLDALAVQEQAGAIGVVTSTLDVYETGIAQLF
jgi:hypothetical protein